MRSIRCSITIIVLVIAILCSIDVTSADILSSGNATTTNIVSTTINSSYLSGMEYKINGYFSLEWDADLRPLSFSHTAENVLSAKQSGVRWYFDPGSPGSEVIPDVVSSVVDVKTISPSVTVGSAYIKVTKIGSCSTPSNTYGLVDIYFEINITNPDTLGDTGEFGAIMYITGETIDDYYDDFTSQRSVNSSERQATTAMASNGFYIGTYTYNFHSQSYMLGTNGTLYPLTTCDGSASENYYLTSYYDFLNYYTITEESDHLEVDVIRDSPEFELFASRSKIRSYSTYGEIVYESTYSSANASYTDIPLEEQTIFIVPDFGFTTNSEIPIGYYGAENTSQIYGHVYDLVNGSVVSNAIVGISGGSPHFTTSDSTGFYLLRTDPGEYNLYATNSGYTNWIEEINFYYPISYEIDIYLLPTTVAHTRHGIIGSTRTLPYYNVAESRPVYISNSTWSSSTTSTNTGYYIFDSLEPDTYYINSSMSGYRDHNETVVVSTTDDISVTIDDCDDSTGWVSGNALTVNTSDKQEGTGSLQSLGSSKYDFNSSFTAVDASSVEKTNGYLNCWLKINDTTRLSSDFTLTIGSDGDNSTNKIFWDLPSGEFSSTVWREVWLKLSDGTESGTFEMSNISWFELIVEKSDTTLIQIDDIVIYDFSYEQHNINYDPVLSFTVTAQTIDNKAIQSYTAILDSSTLTTNMSGALTFSNLSYGVVLLTVISDDYYPYQASYFLDSNMSVTVFLQEKTGADVQYEAHYVAFHIVNWFYRSIPGVNVSISGDNTTVMNFTGSDGVAGFRLKQNIYYSITLTHETDVQTISLMPVYNEYTIFFTPTDQVPPQDTQNWYDFVNFSVTTKNINSTYAYINLTYSDALSATSNLYIYVNDSSDINLINSSANLSIVVNHTQGASFYVGFNCDYIGYDSLSVKKVVVFPWDLGEDSAFTDYTKEIMAIAFLVILGAVFGTVTVKYGGLLLPVFALILNWAGWFTIVDNITTRMVCVTALVLAIMFYFRAAEKETV